MGRLGKLLIFFAVGGLLLQTGTSCQTTLVPIITNLITSLVLQTLIGGIAT